MMIQEAIDKANEGGYHIYGSDGMDTDYEGATHDYSAWTRKDNGPRSGDRPPYTFRGGLRGAGASSTDAKIAINIERGF
jgi:hypothetical protein